MADEKQFAHKNDEINLEPDQFGTLPPAALSKEPEDKNTVKLDGVSGNAMYDYYCNGVIDGVPVVPEWRDLMLKDEELETMFEDECYIESVCFVQIPENDRYKVHKEPHSDYDVMVDKYHSLMRAVSLNIGYIMSESCTYDAAKGGYVIRLVVSLRRKIVRAAFRGHTQKLQEDALKKVKEQGSNAKES